MSKYILLLLASIGLLAGCGSGGGQYESSATTGGSQATETSAKAPTTGSTARLASHSELPRQVVKTGTLTVQVDSVDKAEKQVHTIAGDIGGRIDKVSSSDLAGPNPTIEITLRVPVGSFDLAVDRLESLGTRIGKTVAVDDVTEKLVDMDARMKTMLAQEQALRNMLAQTRKMSDSLAVNHELTDLRGEIESMAAQRKSVGGEAAFSTITLTLQQKATAEAVARTDPNWLQSAWADAWGSATAVFRGIVSATLWLLVFSPFWIVGILLIRWLIKTVNRRPSTVTPV